MTQIFFRIFKFVVFGSLFGCFSMTVFAAEFTFISNVSDFDVGQMVKVDLFLDTEDESINALEGKFIFDNSILELKEVDDGGSVVNYWINKPNFGDNFFAGIVPGGYEGRAKVLSLIFKIKKNANDLSGLVGLTDARVLLNDGKATEASLNIRDFVFDVSDLTDASNPTDDVNPPEKFDIFLSKDENIFGEKYVLIFATQDKDSGVDYYAVSEGIGFYEAQSPYVLSDQGLSNGVVVRAFDKAGNFREAYFDPKKFGIGLWWRSNAILFLIISLSLVAILIFVLLKSLFLKRRARPVRRR